MVLQLCPSIYSTCWKHYLNSLTSCSMIWRWECDYRILTSSPELPKQTPLRHLSFSSEPGPVTSQPIAGPEGLLSLFVKWCGPRFRNKPPLGIYEAVVVGTRLELCDFRVLGGCLYFTMHARVQIRDSFTNNIDINRLEVRVSLICNKDSKKLRNILLIQTCSHKGKTTLQPQLATHTCGQDWHQPVHFQGRGRSEMPRVANFMSTVGSTIRPGRVIPKEQIAWSASSVLWSEPM